ncbi:MAG TPA: type VI secretion system tube protein Hcp [Desulfobulbus sp.]|nr:type VI secretion system tube protein Hcp [Desulfobulbus sp.]
MALNAYLKLTAESTGEIKGSVTQTGREDSIMVIAVEHEIVSPRDAASGLPTGKRQHKALVITKEVDKSSPLLYTVLVNNENITSWELRFWQPSASGQEVQHYTIQLENASISGIRMEMLNNKYPENMAHKEREHVSFTYQKIIWTWEDGGITAQDDWEAPNA